VRVPGGTTRGRIGAVVGDSVFSVRVDRVDVATGIAKPDAFATPPPIPSLGVFVVVHARIRSDRKPFDPGHVRLETRGGLSFDESGRPDIAPSSTGSRCCGATPPSSSRSRRIGWPGRG
jgi:hypothetical protein